MEDFEAITERLQESVRETSPDTGILVTENSTRQTVAVVKKISAILTSHLSKGDLRNQRSSSEGCLLSPALRTRERRHSHHQLGQITENVTTCKSPRSAMEPGDLQMTPEEQDRELTSMEQDAYFKQYLEEHKSQVLLWNQMIDFRREYSEMRGEIERLLTHLQMDLSAMSREASCKFVLFLSQLGCSTCTSGEGLQSCYERFKALQGDFERAQMENTSLLTKLDSLLQTKNTLEEKIEERENAILTLTDTVDQLQSHCHNLEETSADTSQLQDLMIAMENSLKSIGHLVIEDADDSALNVEESAIQENMPESPVITLTILAERTSSAVKAALFRRKSELQEYKVKVEELGKLVSAYTEEKNNNENNNDIILAELNQTRARLGETLGEKQQLVEASHEHCKTLENMREDLENRDGIIQQLNKQLQTEKSLREDLERSLNEMREEEALQRSSHSELVAEYQQMSCDNQLCRTNISSLENRLEKLQRELAAGIEERTRLAVALDFATNEKAEVNNRLQEAAQKNDQLKDQIGSLQLEKVSAEESLSRLQYLKSLDESQLKKLNSIIEEIENDRQVLRSDHSELDEEVQALKHELVKAEETRLRLEYYSTSLENNLQTLSKENEELKEQLERSLESSEEILDRFTALERRTGEAEAENLRLVEEITKLGKELEHQRDQQKRGDELEDELRARIKSAEEEQRRIRDELALSDNSLQLANVSLIALRADLEQAQQNGLQLKDELQQLLGEKEFLSLQLEALQQSSSATVGRLQTKNKEQMQQLTILEEKLKNTLEEKNNNVSFHTKEKDDLKVTYQLELKQKEEFYAQQLEETRLKQQKELQDLRQDLTGRIAKLQDEVAKVEAEKQEVASSGHAERQQLQEKWTATCGELEAARGELMRLRHEEVERQLENRLAAEGFRSEITRLQTELRNASEARAKEQQSAAQLVQATNDNLKRSESNLVEVKNDLVNANRELKETQRQLETSQIQLSRAEMHRDELSKQLTTLRQQLEDLRAEKDNSSQACSSLEGSLKRLETDKLDLLRCLEEARKRIGDLEESRTSLEQEVVELRSNLRDVEQQNSKILADLSSTEQRLARSQDQLHRFHERCEALMEQLHAEQSRAILAEKAAEEKDGQLSHLKLHCQKLELHLDNKVQKNVAQTQQRLDEAQLSLQQAILRAKKAERERYSIHSQLVYAESEIPTLKERLREAELQAKRLREELDRMESQKRDVSANLGKLLATLHSFVAVMKDHSAGQVSASPSFLHRFQGNDSELTSSTNNLNVQDVQTVLKDFMQCVLQAQRRRTELPVHDEPIKLDVRDSHSRTERRRRIDFTGLNSQDLRSGLDASLSAVASHGALGITTLQRESQRLDRLANSPYLLSPGQPLLESTPVKEN